jgi:hypothetical protein
MPNHKISRQHMALNLLSKVKTNRAIENMKNKLRFACFLMSRFKGETIEIIGLGILFYLIVQLFVVHQLDQFTYNVDKYLLIVSFVLTVVGLSIRRYFKKPETKQNPS